HVRMQLSARSRTRPRHSGLIYVTPSIYSSFLFFKERAQNAADTLPLHDALPICGEHRRRVALRRIMRIRHGVGASANTVPDAHRSEEHTSELRHLVISYAVFCLKKKKIYTSLSITLLS